MACIERICRLCLAEAPTSDFSAMIPLNGNSETLNVIRTVTSVEVMLDHESMYFMCTDCNTSLQTCYDFRERCIVNDNIFRRKFTLLKSDPSDADATVPIDYVEPGKESTDVGNTKTEEAELEETYIEENYIEECLVDDVEEDDAEPMYAPPPEVSHYQSSDSESSSPKAKKKVQKRRGRKAKAEVDKSNNKLPCSQCGKMIARNNINQHMLTHDPDRPKVFCAYCGKAFKDPRRMQLHVNSNHTLEKKYPCDICGKVYLRPTSLKDHKATKHTADKRYECTDCGTAFTSWAQRWHHFKKEHTTAKPYACTYCDWAFKFKGDLTLHIRKHTGEKPFKCDICGKAFNKSYNVVIHKKSHRNVVPAEPGLKQEEVHSLPAEPVVQSEEVNGNMALSFGQAEMQKIV
ncbi:hypothetical protein ZHAS_00005046 [Anopheles sinensis]|uniref:Uncharacterized protein n=1 Tax=Anopheles sinensis TaxID=74873 RepID=A0A084VIE0_ANOSI|nr:hypothetical protein ZHAS_00005046 [Anopheles sinensis]